MFPTRRTVLSNFAAVAGRGAPAERFVGVTVMPEYLQVEGIDRVLENLTRRARVTAVTTAPYVMEPASAKDGSREPPIDAGAGKVRLLDRPLWGRRELFVRTSPASNRTSGYTAGCDISPRRLRTSPGGRGASCESSFAKLAGVDSRSTFRCRRRFPLGIACNSADHGARIAPACPTAALLPAAWLTMEASPAHTSALTSRPWFAT